MAPRRDLIILAVLCAIVRAAAASPESDKLFHDGRALLKVGKLAEACEAFARSHKLEAKVGTLLNLADCRERQGQTATAWSMFLEAKQLAATAHDPRQAEAAKRAAAITAKLSYLTLTVAAERHVEGMVIKRNGVAVEPAQWNTPIAIDPGDQVVEAAAPRFTPWSTTVTLGVKQKLEVVVEALVAEPPSSAHVTATVGAATPGGASLGAHAAPDAASPAVREIAEIPNDHDSAGPAPEPHRLPVPGVRPVSVGLMVGGTSDSDAVFGGRITGGMAVPHGALRAIGSVLSNSFLDEPDNNTDLTTRLFALGISVDYVWMPLPQLAFGAGLGLGIDYLVHNMDRGSDTFGWGTLRASPVIVRVLDGRVEAGLHLQYVRTVDRGVVIGLAAIDLFPL